LGVIGYISQENQFWFLNFKALSGLLKGEIEAKIDSSRERNTPGVSLAPRSSVPFRYPRSVNTAWVHYQDAR